MSERSSGSEQCPAHPVEISIDGKDYTVSDHKRTVNADRLAAHTDPAAHFRTLPDNYEPSLNMGETSQRDCSFGRHLLGCGDS